MNKVYVRDSFLDSYNGLPEVFRENIREALVEFRDSRLMKSRHPEKLPAYAGIYSLRADRRYRILMNKIAGGTYVLLLVGPHDVIYDWAEKNKKAVSGMSTDPSDYTPIEEAMPELFPAEPPAAVPEKEPEAAYADSRKGLFRRFHNRMLLKGLAGTEELEMIRGWETAGDFEANKENLNPNSALFLRHLLDGMTVEEALHELNILRQSREEHEAFEKEMAGIRDSFRRNYKDTNFPHLKGETGKFNFLAGPFGSGKTVELVGTINNADEFISASDRILFLVSNPDYLADMRSYISIVADPKQLKRVDVFDYAGLMNHLMEDCGKRWGFDFRVGEINDDDDLLDMFIDAAESVEGLELESWDLMHDFEYVAENYGVFTESEYMKTPRLECVNITENQREKVWEVFQKFISLMEERKLYTVGYAISKLMPAIKKRSYKPYGLILADDVHFLNWLKLDFLAVIGKSPLSAYSVDVMQDYYLHCMRDLTNPACSDENLFYGLKNMRMDSEKLKFACPQIMPGMTKLRNDIKGIEIVRVNSCDPADNIELEEKLCGIVRSFSNPKDNVIVTADEDEAEDIKEILDSRGIKSVIVDDTQSYFDFLLDDGIRICTFLRLGCLTFENVIIANTYEDLMDPNEESGISIPDRYWYFDWTERLGYKMTLFRHSIAASRKTTYLFEPADDQSLVRLYRENVN